jgi:hypothetical protein
MTHKIYMEDYGHKLTTAVDNLKEGAKFSINAEFPLTEETFNTIDWETGVENKLTITTKVNPHPELTWSTVDAEMHRLLAEYDADLYARKRKKEYPDIYDYMDGVVKSDQEQIDKYIADSQAVKDKYPK